MSEEDRAQIKTGTGVSKAWLRKEIEDVKAMLDQLPDCITKDQLKEALGYCRRRIEALESLVGRY